MSKGNLPCLPAVAIVMGPEEGPLDEDEGPVDGVVVAGGTARVDCWRLAPKASPSEVRGWPLCAREPAANGSMKEDGGGRGCDERMAVGEVRPGELRAAADAAAGANGSATTSVSRSKMPAVDEERRRSVQAAKGEGEGGYQRFSARLAW